MKYLRSKFAETKACIIAFVTTRLFYYEKDKQSVNISIIPYKIERKKDVQEKYGKYKDVELIEYRRSKLDGYKYISIRIAHYLYFNVDFHRPL
jgi:hypothetical protein